MSNIHLVRTNQTRDSADKSEARFTQPRDECPRPDYWTSEDVEATENEVVRGVYGLVRLLQPEYVVETGTHRGFMAYAIGEALYENGHGRLDTVEIEPVLAQEAQQRCVGFPQVKVHIASSLDFSPAGPIDFAWLDSGPGDVRVKEFMRYWEQFHDRTIVGFHDSGTHHRTVRLACLELMKRGALMPIFLPTPRGVALCQVLK